MFAPRKSYAMHTPCTLCSIVPCSLLAGFLAKGVAGAVLVTTTTVNPFGPLLLVANFIDVISLRLASNILYTATAIFIIDIIRQNRHLDAR